MAEYIDRENIIPHSIDDDYEEGGERLIVDYKDIEEMSPADVIERAKYDELHKLYLIAIHNHTECVKEIHKYHSNIDKAIEEMTNLEKSYTNMITDEKTLVNECYKQYEAIVGTCLEILKRNIGE